MNRFKWAYLVSQSTYWLVYATMMVHTLTLWLSVALICWVFFEVASQLLAQKKNFPRNLEPIGLLVTNVLYLTIITDPEMKTVPFQLVVSGMILGMCHYESLKHLSRKLNYLILSAWVVTLVIITVYRVPLTNMFEITQQTIITISSLLGVYNIKDTMQKGTDIQFHNQPGLSTPTIGTDRTNKILKMTNEHSYHHYAAAVASPFAEDFVARNSKIMEEAPNQQGNPNTDLNQQFAIPIIGSIMEEELEESRGSIGISQMKSFSALPQFGQRNQSINLGEFNNFQESFLMPSRTDVFQKTPISSLRSKLLELPLLQSEVSAEIIDSKQCMVKLPQLLNVISHPMAILNEKAQVVLSNKALSQLFMSTDNAIIATQVHAMFSKSVVPSPRKSSSDILNVPRPPTPRSSVSQASATISQAIFDQYIIEHPEQDLIDLLLHPEQYPGLNASKPTSPQVITCERDLVDKLTGETRSFTIEIIQGSFDTHTGSLELKFHRESRFSTDNNLILIMKEKPRPPRIISESVEQALLQSAMHWSQLLTYAYLRTKQHHLTELMVNHSQRVLELSRSIVSYACVELNRYTPVVTRFSMMAVFEEIVELNRFEPENKPIELHVKSDFDDVIENDNDLLKQLLIALTSYINGRSSLGDCIQLFAERINQSIRVRLRVFSDQGSFGQPQTLPRFGEGSSPKPDWEMTLCKGLSRPLVANCCNNLALIKGPHFTEVHFFVDNMQQRGPAQVDSSLEESIQPIRISKPPFTLTKSQANCYCKQVLLIEQDRITQLILTTMINELGVTFNVCSDITEANDRFLKYCSADSCPLLRILINRHNQEAIDQCLYSKRLLSIHASLLVYQMSQGQYLPIDDEQVQLVSMPVSPSQLGALII